MNDRERAAMDAAAGILFFAALLLIVAWGILAAEHDRFAAGPTNADCWLILHDGIEVPPFTARDCRP